MDRAFTLQKEIGTTQQQGGQLHCLFKLPVPRVKVRTSNTPNTFALWGLWVSKSLRYLRDKARLPNGLRLKGLEFHGMVVNNSVFHDSPGFLEEEVEVENLMESTNAITDQKDASFDHNVGEMQTSGDLIEGKGRERSSSSDILTSEATLREEHSHISSEEDSSSPPSLGWPIQKEESPNCTGKNGATSSGEKPHLDEMKLQKQVSSISDGVIEIDMMKERFAKLLLGEDMSGSGNGVSTALAISNAITNLCATLFGQLWRLEPLPPEKTVMWRREMEWLLCVSEHIVELIPSWQTFPDGSKLEVMTCRPRADLYINLPALRKLDNMLLEILDSFEHKEFWYVDQGILAPEADGSSSFRRSLQRQDEKWWLPMPRVLPVGLNENSRKHMQHKRECTNQILKAAMAINSATLADMEVPESFMDSLPKNGRASLGDFIYRYISSDQFSPECLLACLDLTSEHQAIELANRVEASIHLWRKRTNPKLSSSSTRPSSKTSWELVKELMVDADKKELLADRAESLLLCLKQKFPGLPQTTLDTSKIQCNKDVGKSILESYSRVLESLAFNIIARIDDLLHVDNLTKHSNQFSSFSNISVISQRSVSIPYLQPTSITPYKTAFTTPNFSPGHLISPDKGSRSTFVAGGKIAPQGSNVKRVLTDYISTDIKGKGYGDPNEVTGNPSAKASMSPEVCFNLECRKEAIDSISICSLQDLKLEK
ncbi:hypothetical protein K2173_019409 [Erythroxylum novogranatense]|uniref:PRONE domain-containing protein n=1 Tax=Erythroxylum novogranatense TaxID=1862640 RepID=A0AAV8UAX1_9ROSI|nr:hypothetical protein K2173_019409 [Erythroxylum novogranatense]